MLSRQSLHHQFRSCRSRSESGKAFIGSEPIDEVYLLPRSDKQKMAEHRKQIIESAARRLVWTGRQSYEDYCFAARINNGPSLVINVIVQVANAR